MMGGWMLLRTLRLKVSLKKGTGEFTKTKGGDDILVVVARYFDKKSNSISLEKKYVKLADCVEKQGQIVTLSLQGEYQYENDFVFSSGSIASATAELICDVYEHEMDKLNKKGI
jgi:hypothetical protein